MATIVNPVQVTIQPLVSTAAARRTATIPAGSSKSIATFAGSSFASEVPTANFDANVSFAATDIIAVTVVGTQSDLVALGYC
jgi:hypothetical protein